VEQAEGSPLIQGLLLKHPPKLRHRRGIVLLTEQNLAITKAHAPIVGVLLNESGERLCCANKVADCLKPFTFA
jgi:hypothetical protein